MNLTFLYVPDVVWHIRPLFRDAQSEFFRGPLTARDSIFEGEIVPLVVAWEGEFTCDIICTSSFPTTTTVFIVFSTSVFTLFYFQHYLNSCPAPPHFVTVFSFQSPSETPSVTPAVLFESRVALRHVQPSGLVDMQCVWCSR